MNETSKLTLLMELKSKLFNEKLVQTQRKFTKVKDSMMGNIGELNRIFSSVFQTMGNSLSSFNGNLEGFYNPYPELSSGAVGLTAVVGDGEVALQRFGDAFSKINQLSIGKGVDTFESLLGNVGKGVDAIKEFIEGFKAVGEGISKVKALSKTFFDGLAKGGNQVKKYIHTKVFSKKEVVSHSRKPLPEVEVASKKSLPKKLYSSTPITRTSQLHHTLSRSQHAKGFAHPISNAVPSASHSNLDLTGLKSQMAIKSTSVGEGLNKTMSLLGNTILPQVVKGMEGFNMMIGIVEEATSVWTGVQWLLDVALDANPVGLIVMGIAALIAAIIYVVSKTEGWGKSWKAFKNIVSAVWDQVKLSFKFFVASVEYGIEKLWLKMKSMGQHMLAFAQHVKEAIKMALHGDFSGAKKKMMAPITTGADKQLEALEHKREKQKEAYKTHTLKNTHAIKNAYKDIGLKFKTSPKKEGAIKPSGALGTTAPLGMSRSSPEGSSSSPSLGATASSQIGNVQGQASGGRTITVNIDAINKGGINTGNTKLSGMDAEEIEAWFKEAITRTIRGIELSHS